MAVQALYRKWRPQTFDEVVGQEHIICTLRNALTSGRIHHAYLFAGPRGTGKTTSARLLAKAVNCLAPEEQRPCNECAICRAVNERRLLDLIEIDAASNTGVDDVRELRERVGFRPNEARYKVYVIDEVHMLSNAAFNALLKTLEEPPPHAIFVLATTRPDKIPDTVLSRCQRHDFRRISLEKIVARLEWLAEQEHIQADREALTLVARQATGSMRDAESLLDQLASYGNAGITAVEVRSALGTGASETVLQVTDALAEGDVAQGLGAINAAMDEGADPRQFARQMVEHLRALLLLRLKSDVMLGHASDDLRPRLETQANAFSARALAQAVKLFNQAAAESKGGWQPQLPLEMAFIEAALPPEAGSPGSPNQSTPANPRTPPPARHSTSSPPKPRSASARSTSPTSSPAPRAAREPAAAYDVPTPGDSSLTPDALRNRWSELLNALRPRNLSLEALMHSCEPMAVEGNIVVLGFTHQFHRSKVEEERNKQVVEEVLSDLLGQRYRVRCILAANKQLFGKTQNPAPTVSRKMKDTEGVLGAQQERTALDTKPTLSAEQIIADDPLVRAAIEELGAQVVQR
ncbi:MAG: DNA polymerase III subunit gamma/tau [Chloroflexi bacterium]|nr:MAG: DNA polymerase III subunit gamma/tau [Chloroflexota bacterium]RLC84414.1 MAG: DNA polymerase III subunit gamma/tau [Chloroflexota bacterium]